MEENGVWVANTVLWTTVASHAFQAAMPLSKPAAVANNAGSSAITTLFRTVPRRSSR